MIWLLFSRNVLKSKIALKRPKIVNWIITESIVAETIFLPGEGSKEQTEVGRIAFVKTGHRVKTVCVKANKVLSQISEGDFLIAFVFLTLNRQKLSPILKRIGGFMVQSYLKKSFIFKSRRSINYSFLRLFWCHFLKSVFGNFRNT